MDQTEIRLTINEFTINKLRIMLESDYKDFEVELSNNSETVKIKSTISRKLPVIVIGR